MNAKKERELLVVGLERLLHSQSKIVDDYGALADLLEGISMGLLLHWVVIEEETHHTLLTNLLHSLKRTPSQDMEAAQRAWR